jgi:hypothetical protein
MSADRESQDPEILPPEDKHPAPKPRQSFARLSLDYSHPESLVNLLPLTLKEKVKKIPTEWRNLPSEDLEKIVPNELGPTGERLRKALFAEFWRALDQRTQMAPAMIYGAVCGEATFMRYMNDPKKLAWLCTPPTEYEHEVGDLLDRGLRRVREILQMPLYTQSNQPNVKVAEIILKAVMMLDMRTKGAYTQRVESKNLNISQELPSPNQVPPKSLLEMEQRIKELEHRAKEIQGVLPPPNNELVGMQAALTVDTVGPKSSPNELKNGKKKNPKAGG